MELTVIPSVIFDVESISTVKFSKKWILHNLFNNNKFIKQ